MLKILNGRLHFYQWDLNQQLVVNDSSVTEVHFCNRTDDCALVCEVYEQDGVRLVDVPNILLQQSWSIKAYAYCHNCYTKYSTSFDIVARTRPTDYVYTETEVRTWERLEQDISGMLVSVEDAVTDATTATNVANAATEGANVAAAYANEKALEAISAATTANDAAFIANEAAEAVDGKITDINKVLIYHDKRITNLEGNAPFLTETSISTSITVPAGALPYASIDKLGGISYFNEDLGTLEPTKVTYIESGNSIDTLDRIEIPAEVQAIDGYGEGVNANYHNYIEWGEDGRIRFHRNVKRITFTGALTSDYWVYSPANTQVIGDNQYCRCQIGKYGDVIDHVAISNNYFNQTTIGAATTEIGVDVVNSTGYKDSGIYIRIAGMTGRQDYVNQLKAWDDEGCPLTVAYALARPEIIDITDLLPFDNLIKVDSNEGYIYFGNNDYYYAEAAPSTVTFQIKGGAQ